MARIRLLLQRFLFALGSLLFTTGTGAQSVLAPPPTDYSQKALVALPTPSGTNQAGATPREPAVAPANSEGLLNWGAIHLKPHFFYSLSYGNGIQASPGQQSKTLVNQLAPGMLFELGSRWRLDYTPTIHLYSSSQFRDGTDQSVSLNGRTTYEDWTFGLSQSYVSSSDPLVDTGGQTDQETFSTAINAAYQLNSKVSLDAAINQNLRLVGADASTNQLTDSRTWSTTAGFNYQLYPRLTVGIGATVAYDDVRAGTDMTSEQLQGRINWRPGEKLTLSFTGGYEYRQFLDSTQPSSLAPIFNLSLLYRVFDPTTLSLSASRSVSPSYFQDQVSDITAVSLGVRQRLFQKFFLGVSATYNTTSYQATTSGVAANRQDDYVSMTVRLSCPFLKKCTLSVFYDWSDNTSNEAGYSYTSNQVGLEVGYRY